MTISLYVITVYSITVHAIGHKSIGHNYMGHNYMGHNYIGHNYIGHNFIGHNYIGLEEKMLALDKDLVATQAHASELERLLRESEELVKVPKLKKKCAWTRL